MSIVRKYLSPYVVDVTGVHYLSVITKNGSQLISIAPFEVEVAGVEYVPRIIVVVEADAEIDMDMLRGNVHGDMLTTAKAVSAMLQAVCKNCENWRNDVTLYAIDVQVRSVSRLE